MRWDRLQKVAAAAWLCALAACGGGGNPSAPLDATALKGPPGGVAPGLVGNDKACAAILRGGRDMPAHVRNACAPAEPPPPPPQLLAPTGLAVGYATKSYTFTWNPSTLTDITRYELLEDRDGAGPLPPGTVATSSTTAVTLQLGLLHERINAEYAVRVCTAAGCSPSSAVVRPDVVQAAGTFQAATPGAQERFGESIAVSADASTIAVGVPFENNALTTDPQPAMPQGSGSVYVFTRGAAGWVQQAYLVSSRPGPDARFGTALALSADGSTLAVGSGTDPVQGFQSGSVDVFVRTGTSWAHQAYVQPSNPGRLHQFGSALALSSDGNTLAVGAFTENNPAAGTLPPNPVGSTSPVGAVYVFTRTASAWTQQAHIQHPQPALGDNFGRSVALSADGNTLAIGTPARRMSASGPRTGAVYVFQRTAAAWSQQALLTASNAAVAAGNFGHSVALSSDGNTLAAGAPAESSGVAGNPNDTSAMFAGAAYVFTRSGSAWMQQAYMKAHNPELFDQFGISVSVSGDGSTLAVGASMEDGSARWFGSTTGTSDNLVLNAGAVYVYQLGTAGWTETGYLKPGNGNRETALFGAAVALSRDGSALAVGAPAESSAAPGGGAAYLF